MINDVETLPLEAVLPPLFGTVDAMSEVGMTFSRMGVNVLFFVFEAIDSL